MSWGDRQNLGKIDQLQQLPGNAVSMWHHVPAPNAVTGMEHSTLFKNFHLSVNEVHSYSFTKCQCQHAVPAVSGAFTSKVCVYACLCQSATEAVTRLSSTLSTSLVSSSHFSQSLTFPAITWAMCKNTEQEAAVCQIQSEPLRSLSPAPSIISYIIFKYSSLSPTGSQAAMAYRCFGS